jgi:uncharacterized protein (DUF342 family)
MNKTFTSKSGNVSLELRKDSSSAWLTIRRSGRLVDEKEILDLIDEAGIKSGFEEALQLVRERGLEKEYDKPFPIAICQKGESKEASLHYHFDPEAIPADIKEVKPEMLNRISYVHEGDVIAGYSDNIFERDGSIYDIFGDLITPPVVDEEEARGLAGRYVRYESRDFIAEQTGYPYLDHEGRISIITELSVDAADIPPGMFLRSPLALSITGDLSNAHIAGARALQVTGDLTDCRIYCESDMLVTGTISNCINPGIQVLGALRVGGISHSRVYVKEGIEFDGILEHATIACDGDILGTYAASGIVGGLIQSGGNIELGTAGSSAGDETEIEIAISPFYRALLMQMTKEAVRLREEGDDQALDELHERIRRCEAELDNQLNSFLKRPADMKKALRVSGEVYPKTLFRVLKHSYQIKSRQTGISLIEKE